MRVSATYALEMLIQKYWQHVKKKSRKQSNEQGYEHPQTLLDRDGDAQLIP